MIEAGIVALAQADAGVKALCPVGGFCATLPKGAILPSWTYLVVSRVPDYTLSGRNKLTMTRLQIDCFGQSAADAINLSEAIREVLSGYQGTLPDADATVVQAAFHTDTVDFFDDLARTSRRMIEFEIHFSQP